LIQKKLPKKKKSGEKRKVIFRREKREEILSLNLWDRETIRKKEATDGTKKESFV